MKNSINRLGLRKISVSVCISFLGIAILFLWNANGKLHKKFDNSETIKDHYEKLYNSYLVCQTGVLWQTYNDSYHHFSINYPIETDIQKCIDQKSIQAQDSTVSKITVKTYDPVHPSFTQNPIEGTTLLLGKEVQMDILSEAIEEVRGSMAEIPFLKVDLQINPYIHIPAEKYISYNYDRGSKPYFQGVVLFEWNTKTYQLTFTPRLYHDPEEKFNTVVSSLKLDGSYYVPQEEYVSNRTYTDPFYQISAFVPQGWSVRQAGGTDGSLFTITNEPVDIYLQSQNRTRSEKYSYIYIGHGCIYSTACAGVCYNTTCAKKGTLSTTIEGRQYDVDYVAYTPGEYRFQLELERYEPTQSSGGIIYVTARFNPNHLSNIRAILNSITFER